MVVVDVPLICFSDGNLRDENKNATYIGGYKKFSVIRNNISFTAFKQKIQELIKQPQSGIDFRIKVEVQFDDVTVIAIDVDDDISLRSAIDNSKIIKAYIIKQPTGTTFIETQREEEELLDSDDSHLQSQQMVSVMGISNDNHDRGVRGDYNLGKELENTHPSLCPSSLHGLSQSKGNAQQGAVISPQFSVDYHMIEEFLAEFSCDENLLDAPRHNNYPDWSLGTTFDISGVSSDWSQGTSCHNSEVSNWSLGTSCYDSGVSDLGTSCHDSGVPDLGDFQEFDHREDNNISSNLLKETELEHPSYEGCLDELEGVCDIYIGQEFDNIDLFKLSLSDMAIKTRRQHKPIKSRKYKLEGKDNTEFEVRCRDEGCNWLVQALKSRQGSFKVTRSENVHECLMDPDCGSKDHPQATIKWIVSKMHLAILKNPAMEPKKIVKAMKERFGIKISYNKAVKAKTKISEEMHARSVGCYSILPNLAEELEQDGSVAKLGLASDGSTFLYFFWAFSACIHALHAHLRPILFIGTKRISAGFLIYARGVDGNGFDGQSVHVAFAVFATENDMASEMFMGCLKEFILPPAPDKDMLPSSSEVPFTIVTSLKERVTSTAVKNVLPWTHHSFSMLGDEFDGPFLTKELFEDHNRADKPSKALDEHNSAYDTSVSPSILKSLRSGDTLLGGAQPLSSPSPHHCDVMFDEDENMIRSFDILTIVDVVEHTRNMVLCYFSERQSVGAKLVTALTPGVMCYVNGWKACLPLCKVESISGDKYELTEECLKRFVVSMVERSCTCGLFQERDFPCQHAVMVIEHENLNIMNYFTQWFTADCYRGTYAGKLPSPTPCISQRQPSSSEACVLPPPMEKKSVGRPRKRRQKEHS